MTTAQLIAHTLVVLVLIAAAVVLTVTGHDGTPAWAALGGYAGGSAFQAVTTPKGP